MAKRRLLRALGGGVLALGQGIQADRKEAMLRQRQAQDDERTAQRAREMFKLQADLQQKMEGIKLASKGDLMPSTAKSVGQMLGIDLTPGIMPEPARAAKILELIEKQKLGETTDIGARARAMEIPEDTGLPGGAGDEGPARPTTFNSLMEAQANRQRSLEAEEKRASTLRTTEAGATATAQALGQNTPEVGTAKAAVEKQVGQAKQDVELDPKNVNRRVSEAARTAGAQAQARWNVEWSPAATAAHVDRTRKEALERALVEGNANKAKQLAEATDASMKGLQLLKEAEGLSRVVNTATARNFPGRAMQATKARTGWSNDAKRLADLWDAGGIVFAQALGNKGATSEADKKAGQAYIPSPMDSDVDAKRKLLRGQALLKVGPMVISQLPPEATPEQRWELANKLVEQLMAEGQANDVAAQVAAEKARREQGKRGGGR